MCGNCAAIWYKEEEGTSRYGPETSYYGPEGFSDAWFGKLEPTGNKFRWSYRFTREVVLTGEIAEEDSGREIIETLHQALDLAEDFTVVDLAAVS